MTPPRKAIIAITSARAPLYPEGKETGLFITEALHPFKVFRAAGFEVDLVSETGTYSPDWLSEQKDWLPEEDRKIYEDHNSEFRKKLDNLLKPSDVKWEEYGLFFASAGHASLIDYPTATGLQSLASNIYYRNAGVMSAVCVGAKTLCHGGAIFLGLYDPETKEPMIKGKRVTGFTNKGEEEEGILDVIKSWDKLTIEAGAARCGAQYIPPPGPWDAYSIIDGRLVTGANPASAHVTAENAVKAFDALA